MLIRGVQVMLMPDPVRLFNMQFDITCPNGIMYPDFGTAEVGACIQVELPAIDNSKFPTVFQFKPDGLEKRKLPDKL